MTLIYHLTTKAEWDEALRTGEYRAGSLATEGFIHASTENQLEASADRHFAQQSSLLLLTIDLDLVQVRLIWEESPHSVSPFPHLYGPLNLDAVVGVLSWTRENGRFTKPASLGT